MAPIGDRHTPSDPGRCRLRGLNLARQRDGSLLVNALLVYGVDPDDSQALFEQASREAGRVLEHPRRSDFWLFGPARLSGVAPQLYIRESRHLVGLYRLRFPASDDRSDPGYPAAIQLLRRGLFAAPAYYRGGLYLREPLRLGDFLADLEYFYRAKNPLPPSFGPSWRPASKTPGSCSLP